MMLLSPGDVMPPTLKAPVCQESRVSSSTQSVSTSTASSQIAAATRVSPKTRAIDGDYKTPNVMSSHVKDSDGDYKVVAASPAAQSSSAVQTALSTLKTGG
jgi:hypothetical protein